MKSSDRNRRLRLGLAVAVGACGTAGAAVFGDAALSVTFDDETGWPVCFASGDARVDLPRDLAPCVSFAGAENAATEAAAPVARGMRQIDDRTFVSRLERGAWRVDAFVRLHPARRRVQRGYRLTYLGDAPGPLRTFRVSSGRVAVDAARGRLIVPQVFPPFDRAAAAFDARQTHHAWEPPYAVIADTGRGASVLFAADTKTPHSDAAPAAIREEPGALEVTRTYKTCGRVAKGDVQEVGDDWICFVAGDGEAARAALPDWYAQIGRRAPDDRPDWVRRLVLYSLHPRGPIAADYNGWGGFGPAADHLPRLRALGVNGLWVLPVEDQWPYTPRDYYAFMPRVGTALEARAFTDRAHALGFKVLHDIVPHGGRNDTPRARTHPEWIVRREDGTTPTYWCHDFNWPSWRDFLGGVARHNTAAFALDGLRIDAADGSHEPNWNPAIPYARASFAQSQGGYAMIRALRAAARAVNPAAAVLAETSAGFHATESDLIYDHLFCHDVLPRLPTLEPSEAAAALRRRFQETALASPPGTLRMRYPESHDSLRADLLYGPALYRALMAVAAWTPGVPMVLQESEDGHADALQEIFALRAALPGLNETAADYLSVKAPPGVFAVRHGADTIALVNLNPDRTQGTVTPPVGAPFALDLPPFGYTVVRAGQDLRRPPPEAAREDARPPDVETVRRAGEVVFFIKDAEAWFAHAADGSFASPFRVRHPDYDGTVGPIYHLPQGDNVLWRSSLHPFGFAAACAEVGGTVGGRAAVVSGFGPDSEVLLLDRLGDERGLHVVVRGAVENVRVSFAAAGAVRSARPVWSGDARLKAVCGGWQFEDGDRRVRFRRNGARLGEWARDADGVWRRVKGADDGRTATETVGGKTVSYAQRHDVEAAVRLERRTDGEIQMTFDGVCRAKNRLGKMRRPVRYRTVWRLGNGRLDCTSLPPKGKDEP